MSRGGSSNIIPALSLLLCVAVCVLWAASYASAVSVSDGRLLILRVGGADADEFLRAQREGARRSAAEVCRQLWRRSPGAWDRAGFGRATGSAGEFVTVRPSEARFLRYSWNVVSVPLWALAAPLAVAPAVWLASRARGRRRRGAGLCAGCGYDMRATPGRCPECGAVPAGGVA